MSWTKRAGEYLNEVRAETAKVSWPNRKEIQANTGVVILTVAILSVFIFLLDRVFLFVLGLLLGRPSA
jgi:preprotein translocase subunit SecE